VKKYVAILLCLALALGTAAVLASGSLSGETLITKSYVDSTVKENILTEAQKKIDDAAKAGYDQAAAQIGGGSGGVTTGKDYHASFRDRRFKEGDTVAVPAGSGFLLLAGEVTLNCPTGKVIDVSSSWPQTRGGLHQGHRYLVTEDTTAQLTVTSPTAVLSLEGYSTTTLSKNVDYNAIASGLAQLGLFKGSGSGYGSGYDLEQHATRVQGLIMFLRLIGEEEDALASSGDCPFVDVPEWSKPYVLYSYQKGYTKGVDATHFAPDTPIAAREYVTLLLRALGYSEEGDSPDFTWDIAVDRAFDLGILTGREHKLLVEKEFLRAQMAYLSFFTLEEEYKSGGTLADRLVERQTITRDGWNQVRKDVAAARLR